MYKLICQLFLAVIGQNLPEEVFEGTLFWLLQGGRKNRQIIDRNVKQFSIMTPHQLQITGWPKEYIEGRSKKGRIKVHSILICEKFRQMFHTLDGEIFSPCHRYIKIWEEGGDWGSDVKTKIRVILYFNSLEDKEKTKKLIDNHSGFKNIYEDKILKYCLNAEDYSHLCMCSICSKFMPSRAERLQINKRDPEIFEVHCHQGRCSISDKYDWNHELCQVPICVECLNLKERQEKYRLNMYNHEHFKYSNLVNSSEERHNNNLEESLEVEKPDMTNIPHKDKFMWETPFDYCGSLRCLLNPHSTYYWHPGLTADEYMRYQDHKSLQLLKNAEPLANDHYPDEDNYDDYGEYPEDNY